MKLFGSSGIRDVVDKDLLQLMFEVGLVTGSSCRSVAIGCDTRTSSDAMKFAFLAGILSRGGEAADAGVIPTPTLAYASRHFKAGAMITASHNPPQYNGIKLVNPDGSAFDSTQRERIEKKLSDKSYKLAPWQKMKRCSTYNQAIEEHIERILTDTPRKLKIRVVLDCGCGAASVITPNMLSQLGCKVIALNCQPSGHFPREIEPLPQNLGDLMKAVRAEKAAIGIAHDGDADRVAVIDDKGNYVSGDKLIALFARYLAVDKVVTTVDASMILDELGFEIIRTKVGDAFVSDELRGKSRENTRMFGAEPSGCFIFPEVSLCPDGIYAAAKIAQIAAEHRISSLVSRLPTPAVIRGSVTANRAIMQKVERKLETEKNGQLTTIDGIRLAFSDGWLMIRPSGTEPKIRITAEAKDKKRAQELFQLGLAAIENGMKQERAKR